MRDNDINNIQEKSNEDNNFDLVKVACSAEFSEGCIFSDEE